MCLLLMLCELAPILGATLHVIHVHHGIRAESADRDAAFVEALAKRLGVDILVRHIDVPTLARERHKTTEEAAREARYQCMREYARSIGDISCPDKGLLRIAVAHNRDDQAETVLLHLFRGSGLKGLTGMPPMRPEGEYCLIRPLLCLSRAEIETYLSCAGQEYMTDETNLDPTYSRNFIRTVLMPQIKERFGGDVPGRIAAAAGRLRQADDLLSSLGTGPIPREIADALEPFFPGGQGLGSAHLEAIEQAVSEAAGTRQISLPGGVIARVRYGELSVTGPDTTAGEVSYPEAVLPLPCEREQTTTLPGLGTIHIAMDVVPPVACAVHLNYDKIALPMLFRVRARGDTLSLSRDDSVHKSIRSLMTDRKVPACERDSMYMLACADPGRILWIPGLKRADAWARARGGENRTVAVWIT